MGRVGGGGDDALVDELAKAISDPGAAKVLAARAGFPTQNLPAFETALMFWSRVIQDARSGMVRGGVQAVADEAARQFPENPIFKGYRAEGGTNEGGRDDPSPDPVSPEELRRYLAKAQARHAKVQLVGFETRVRAPILNRETEAHSLR